MTLFPLQIVGSTTRFRQLLVRIDEGAAAYMESFLIRIGKGGHEWSGSRPRAVGLGEVNRDSIRRSLLPRVRDCGSGSQ
jgi:hypothetical protein